MACPTRRHWGKGLEIIYPEVIGRSKEALAMIKVTAGEKSQEMEESRRVSEEPRKRTVKKRISFKLGPKPEETYIGSDSIPPFSPSPLTTSPSLNRKAF